MGYYLIIMCLNTYFPFFLKNLKTLDRTAQQVSFPTCEPEQSISQSLNKFNQLTSPFLPKFLEKISIEQRHDFELKEQNKFVHKRLTVLLLCLAHAVTSASGSLSDALVTALWSTHYNRADIDNALFRRFFTSRLRGLMDKASAS